MKAVLTGMAALATVATAHAQTPQLLDPAEYSGDQGAEFFETECYALLANTEDMEISFDSNGELVTDYKVSAIQKHPCAAFSGMNVNADITTGDIADMAAGIAGIASANISFDEKSASAPALQHRSKDSMTFVVGLVPGDQGSAREAMRVATRYNEEIAAEHSKPGTQSLEGSTPHYTAPSGPSA